MNKNTIYELKDYALTIGVSKDAADTYQQPVYLVENRVTGVCEAETRFLAQAYEYVNQLQAGLDKQRDELLDNVKPQKAGLKEAVINADNVEKMILQ